MLFRGERLSRLEDGLELLHYALDFVIADGVGQDLSHARKSEVAAGQVFDICPPGRSQGHALFGFNDIGPIPAARKIRSHTFSDLGRHASASALTNATHLLAVAD